MRDLRGRTPQRRATRFSVPGRLRNHHVLPPNDQAHLPGPLGELWVTESLHAAPVRCSDWFGGREPSVHPWRSVIPGGSGTRRARTAAGLPADNNGEEEPNDGETEEDNGDIIERLPL